LAASVRPFVARATFQPLALRLRRSCAWTKQTGYGCNRDSRRGGSHRGDRCTAPAAEPSRIAASHRAQQAPADAVCSDGLPFALAAPQLLLEVVRLPRARVGVPDLDEVREVLTVSLESGLPILCVASLIVCPGTWLVTPGIRPCARCQLSPQPAPPALRASAAGPWQPDQRRGSGATVRSDFNRPLG
jgi:hypothetical protein